MRNLLVFLLVALVGLACTREPVTARPGVEESSGPLALTAAGWKAFDLIRGATRFEGTRVGIAGRPSPYGIAYCTLLRERDAARAFRISCRDGSTAGKLYGLCGLYYTDTKGFSARVAAMRSSAEEVQSQSGCIVFKDTVASLVEGPTSTTVRLRYREQAIGELEKEWEKDHGPADSMDLDIAGGGYPAMLRELDKYVSAGPTATTAHPAQP